MGWIRFRAELRERQAVAERQHLASFVLNCSAPGASAGQFVQLNLPEVFWPRPFSLLDWDAGGAGPASFRILFSEAGRGTRALARLPLGSRLEGHGPLGRGFPRLPGPLWMVAGGYGVAPLLYVSRGASDPARVRFFYGATRAPLLWDSPELAALDSVICTEDGSRGERGTVLDAVRRALDAIPAGAGPAPTLFACGPMGLLAATAALARERALEAYVSVEAPMPCGVGVCRGCAVPVAHADPGGSPVPAGEPPAPTFAMACEDGPAFDARRIDWEREAACRT
ncbi:MAG: hypothetical protein HZB25_12035 [Candidatus Eisenbacteria bacterium]|nr:hypothetical protein [Candidatus Eisenbacteria bacterium]